MLTVDDSFEQTSRRIERIYGQKVSANTVERVVHQVGAVALKRQDQQLQEFFEHREPPAAELRPNRLYVAADGTTVHEQDGWHEAKSGSIYFEDERFGTVRRYVAGFDNSEKFGWFLWLEACRCGLREAKEVVYLGDGAGWVRTEHDKHFAKATFIIDWYHLEEHVWDCGKVLFGEGTQATDRWVDKVLTWLWDGWTRKVLEYLSRQRDSYVRDKSDAIDDLHH